MFLRRAGLGARRFVSAMAQSMTPMEDAIRSKESSLFQPKRIATKCKVDYMLILLFRLQKH